MNKPIGLYIHIPFCIRKCLYCDFCSDADATPAQMHAYTDALLLEMSANVSRVSQKRVESVFFGGGTPTLLPLAELERILNFIRERFFLAPDAEITLEANPASIDAKGLAALRQMGFNRISVGVQSMVERELSLLGRVHSASDACAFLRDAREAGFQNVNVDVMYGIPSQSVSSFLETVDAVLRLSPEHISAYSLILEEGTPFFEHRRELPFPSEDEEEEMYCMLCERLRVAGYEHYEISNFAKAGYECRHNLLYWHSEEYLGFGVAAYSFLDSTRYGNHRDRLAYVASPLDAVADKEILSILDRAYEYIMLRLRLSEGILFSEYERLFGIKIDVRYRSLVTQFVQMGWMKEAEGRIFLTEAGMRFSNTVLVAFLEEHQKT